MLRARLPLSAGVDRAAARARGALPRARSPARACTFPREFDAGHVYHLFPVLIDARDALPGAPARRRRRDADPLPGADSAAAGARAADRRPTCPIADRVCARGAVAAAVSVARRRRRRGAWSTRPCGTFRKDVILMRECSDHRRRRLHRLPSRRGAARRRPRSHRPRRPVDRVDRQHRAPRRAAPSFPYTIDTVFNEPLLAELVDRADVVFHLAAAVGVKLIVEQPVHTIETNVHGTEVDPAAREQEEEAGVHRLDLRGLRQEHRRAVPRGRRPGAWARPRGTAGRTPAARRSTSSWPSPTGRRSKLPVVVVPLLQHRRPAADRTVRHGAARRSCARRWPASRSPCSATAPSRAASPTSATSSARCSS